MKDAHKEYNDVLNFCRDEWQRKYNIEEALGINSHRLGTMLRRLVTRKLIETRYPTGNSKIYEYKAAPNAVYTLAVRTYPKTIAQPQTSGIVREGNVTKVSSNGYHTTGNKTKRSVWVGSTADLI